MKFKDAIEDAATSKHQTLDPITLGSASLRLAEDQNRIQRARILWVDDVPRNNLREARLLKAAGLRVQFATNTNDAIDALNKEDFDLVVSDIDRGAENDSGLILLSRLGEIPTAPPLVFYVGSVQYPPPKGAFGITARPDELVHLVLDVLARRHEMRRSFPCAY